MPYPKYTRKPTVGYPARSSARPRSPVPYQLPTHTALNQKDTFDGILAFVDGGQMDKYASTKPRSGAEKTAYLKAHPGSIQNRNGVCVHTSDQPQKGGPSPNGARPQHRGPSPRLKQRGPSLDGVRPGTFSGIARPQRGPSPNGARPQQDNSSNGTRPQQGPSSCVACPQKGPSPNGARPQQGGPSSCVVRPQQGPTPNGACPQQGDPSSGAARRQKGPPPIGPRRQDLFGPTVYVPPKGADGRNEKLERKKQTVLTQEEKPERVEIVYRNTRYGTPKFTRSSPVAAPQNQRPNARNAVNSQTSGSKPLVPTPKTQDAKKSVLNPKAQDFKKSIPTPKAQDSKKSVPTQKIQDAKKTASAHQEKDVNDKFMGSGLIHYDNQPEVISFADWKGDQPKDFQGIFGPHVPIPGMQSGTKWSIHNPNRPKDPKIKADIPKSSNNRSTVTKPLLNKKPAGPSLFNDASYFPDIPENVSQKKEVSKAALPPHLSRESTGKQDKKPQIPKPALPLRRSPELAGKRIKKPEVPKVVLPLRRSPEPAGKQNKKPEVPKAALPLRLSSEPTGKQNKKPEVPKVALPPHLSRDESKTAIQANDGLISNYRPPHLLCVTEPEVQAKKDISASNGIPLETPKAAEKEQPVVSNYHPPHLSNDTVEEKRSSTASERPQVSCDPPTKAMVETTSRPHLRGMKETFISPHLQLSTGVEKVAFEGYQAAGLKVVRMAEYDSIPPHPQPSTRVKKAVFEGYPAAGLKVVRPAEYDSIPPHLQLSTGVKKAVFEGYPAAGLKVVRPAEYDSIPPHLQLSTGVKKPVFEGYPAAGLKVVRMSEYDYDIDSKPTPHHKTAPCQIDQQAQRKNAPAKVIGNGKSRGYRGPQSKHPRPPPTGVLNPRQAAATNNWCEYARAETGSNSTGQTQKSPPTTYMAPGFVSQNVPKAPRYMVPGFVKPDPPKAPKPFREHEFDEEGRLIIYKKVHAEKDPGPFNWPSTSSGASSEMDPVTHRNFWANNFVLRPEPGPDGAHKAVSAVSEVAQKAPEVAQKVMPKEEPVELSQPKKFVLGRRPAINKTWDKYRGTFEDPKPVSTEKLLPTKAPSVLSWKTLSYFKNHEHDEGKLYIEASSDEGVLISTGEVLPKGCDLGSLKPCFTPEQLFGMFADKLNPDTPDAPLEDAVFDYPENTHRVALPKKRADRWQEKLKANAFQPSWMPKQPVDQWKLKRDAATKEHHHRMDTDAPYRRKWVHTYRVRQEVKKYPMYNRPQDIAKIEGTLFERYGGRTEYSDFR